MAGGGVDDRCALARLDLEVVPVGVMMDHDGGDRYGLRLAGLDVSGQDLVARLGVGVRRMLTVIRRTGADAVGVADQAAARAGLDGLGHGALSLVLLLLGL